MGVGRFCFVAVPIILTIAAIIALLIPTLAGVSHYRLYLFRIDASNLTVNPSNLRNLASTFGFNLGNRLDNIGNITAGSLGLGTSLEVNLWGYCRIAQDGNRTCTQPQFDWASRTLDTSILTQLTSTLGGANIQLPSEVTSAISTFRTISKWTQIAFIVALVSLGLELVVGVFATCSRVASCFTWVISCIAAILTGIAAALATVMATTVVGAAQALAQNYGLRSNTNTGFLAAVWIAVVLAVAAAAFWLFTVCCCKPERRDGYRGPSRFKDPRPDGEKLLTGKGYAPLGEAPEMSGGNSGQLQSNQLPSYSYRPQQATQYPTGNGFSNTAYEPYSHRT